MTYFFKKIAALFLMVCLWSISQNIFAQNNNIKDVLVLKNGNKIKGQIIQKTEEVIRIRLYGGSEMAYQLQDIEEIIQEVFVAPLQAKEKGYFSMSNIGYNIIAEKDYNEVLSIQYINGYRFNPNLAIGVGIGLWHRRIWGELHYPIFLSISGDFMKRTKITPTYAIEPGTLDGHFYLGLSTGIKIKSKAKASFICSLNYQKVRSNNLLFLRTGFSF